MKKNEIIELNGKEYTIELNRQSAIKIEQYANLQEAMLEMREPLLDYVEDIKEDEDPFANEIDFEEYNRKAEEKLEILKRTITRAFWIWLYPENKLNIEEVKALIEPYFETDKKIKFISENYGKFLSESTEIKDKYLEEQKNLKAQVNK